MAKVKPIRVISRNKLMNGRKTTSVKVLLQRKQHNSSILEKELNGEEEEELEWNIDKAKLTKCTNQSNCKRKAENE